MPLPLGHGMTRKDAVQSTAGDAAPGAVGLMAIAIAVFSEVAIIDQLASTVLETRLPKGMVAAQFAVLSHLSSRPDGNTPLELARAFQAPKTSMTHSLAALKRAGHVEIAPNPGDRRSKIVRITPAGLAFRAGVIAALTPDIARSVDALELGTLDRLLPLLRHLRVVLDAARDG